ncbi:MAG: hypothetical protein KGJ64_03030, partial [Betaproteobacteria bacterium]|nr:hypothetical protein [Betaproteobacteria bacterium]
MNMYPPHSDGGYPLLCKETVEALEARGHQILVLTSRMGLEGGTSIEGNVWRVFDYCPDNAGNELRSGTPKDLWHWYRREWVELGLLQRALTEFKPQATFIWATKGMSYSLAIRLLREPLPSFAYVCGYWLHDHNNLGHLRRQYTSWHWDTTSSVRSWFRRVLRRLIEARGIAVDWVPLQLDHLAFNSEAILADLNPACSRTAPVKIVDSAPVERFAQVGPSNIGRPRRILF